MSETISVGITTRDRPAALRSCLESLQTARDLIAEILVFDDGSREPPVDALPPDLRAGIVMMRDTASPGYIEGRNRLMEAASRPWVLLLDDDTRLLSRDALVSGIRVLEQDPRIAAVAFAQAEQDGRPWPERMQPAPGSGARQVRSFIGFAHLLRRDVFRALGSYRAFFRFYGEEKDYCLRLLDAGYAVVYLPEARIAHVVDPAGRDARRYLRYVARNDCLNALLNDPLPRLAWRLPARMALYFRMRRGWRIADPGGFRWLVAELVRARRDVRRNRRPVSVRALRRWRKLGVAGEPYAAPRPD